MSEPRPMEASPWQHACPKCGYQNGFHISFRRQPPDSEGNDAALWLICPSCSSLYDLGVRTRLQPLPEHSLSTV